MPAGVDNGWCVVLMLKRPASRQSNGVAYGRETALSEISGLIP
jgi:hypothetical protein